jgi:hypothetical protein
MSIESQQAKSDACLGFEIEYYPEDEFDNIEPVPQV